MKGKKKKSHGQNQLHPQFCSLGRLETSPAAGKREKVFALAVAGFFLLLLLKWDKNRWNRKACMLLLKESMLVAEI